MEDWPTKCRKDRLENEEKEPGKIGYISLSLYLSIKTDGERGAQFGMKSGAQF